MAVRSISSRSKNDLYLEWRTHARRRTFGRRRVETKADTRNRSLVDVSSCHCLLVCVGDYLKIDRREATVKSNTKRNPY